MERHSYRQTREYRLLDWLTRQSKPVTFEDAANAIGGIPLGVAPTLGKLSQGLHVLKTKNRPIPLIQLIVVNKKTGAPGWRAGQFLSSPYERRKYPDLSDADKRKIMDPYQNEVFNYRGWKSVLKDFEAWLATGA